uniref:Uncharacterized protein n=1 Tax=Aegilops tauschii subsp. strangulata TaxID=200361 RepID=A0A453EGI0_AEGTS
MFLIPFSMWGTIRCQPLAPLCTYAGMPSSTSLCKTEVNQYSSILNNRMVIYTLIASDSPSLSLSPITS